MGLKVLAVIALGLAAGAIYNGIAGNGERCALCAALAALCFMLMPAFHLRASRKRKIRERQDAMVCFEYSGIEADEIAAQVKPVVRKTSIRMSVLLCICLAVIFAPFVAISLKPGSGLPPMLPMAAVGVALPWLSVLFAPMAAAYTVRKVPCVSVVGKNCVLVTNRYPGINDRIALEAEAMRYETGDNSGMAKLFVRYRFRAGRIPTTIRRWVMVPVPRGCEQQAEQIAKSFNNKKE